MSDEVSALGGVTRSEGIAKVTEMPLQGMVTVRGDLSDKVLKKAILAVTKLEVPVSAEINQVGEYALCWMSPDELLMFCPYASVEIILAKLNKSLLKTHSLVADISDARTIFCVSGSMARDVIAKLAPVDISPKAFQNGMFRRSRLAQVSAAFWMPADEVVHVICFRSHAQYVFTLLKVAAQKGSGLNVF